MSPAGIAAVVDIEGSRADCPIVIGESARMVGGVRRAEQVGRRER